MTFSNLGRWLAPPSLLIIMAAAPPAHARPDAGALHLAAAETGNTASASTALADLDTVDAYRLALLKMKGHLGTARTLLQVREPGADYHLQQPVRKIFRGIEPVLESRSAPLTVDILEQLERATEAEPQAALTMLDSAASAIDGSFAQPGPLNPRSVLALSEALLREAVDLYARSVMDNEVVDIRRYQTGRGFAIQAEALIRHATGLANQPGHETLIAAVVLIRQAWPGVIPPPITFDPEGVAGRLDDAVAAMRELR